MNKYIIVLLISFITFPSIYGQKDLFEVQKIGIKEGLPSRFVFDIVQDKDGFIWISSPGKISRYDGNNFKTYHARDLKISEVNSTHLAVDENNNIWFVVMGKSAAKFKNSGVIDTEKDSIYTIEAYSNNLFKKDDIASLNRSIVNNNEWFIATRQGKIYKYKNGFEEIYQSKKSVDYFFKGQAQADDAYWVIQGTELKKVVNQKVIENFSFDSKEEKIIYPKRIVQRTPSVIVEVIQEGKRFAYWELEGTKFVPYCALDYPQPNSAGLVYATKDHQYFYKNGKIVIQNYTGEVLFQYDNFEKKGFGQGNLKYQTAYLDRQNILWISTENGLLKIIKKKNPFSLIEPNNSIRGIYLDTLQQLWVGGYLRSNRLNLSTNEEQELQLNGHPAMGFQKDSDGQLWIGNSGHSLLRYESKRKEFTEYAFDNVPSLYLPFENPISKKLWIGTSKGLSYFDKSTQQVIPIPLTKSLEQEAIEVRHFHYNSKGIWVVTDKGLLLMDSKNEVVLKHINTFVGLPFDNLNHLHEDKEGIFWLATKGDGLIAWNIAKNTFKQYRKENGLSNNTIYAVYEDDFENLWLPSDYGLMCFDKKTLSTRVFLPENGIAHEEFNTFAHHKAKDGTLFFGGLNGITTFHPKDIKVSEKSKSTLQITNVKVVEADEKTYTEKTDEFLHTNKIELNPGDRNLEIELTLLDFIKSTENQFAYQIEGHQDQWVYTADNKIFIVKLPYGQHTLKVKARNALGNWSSKELNIPITVATPFYLQWWFILLAVLACIGSIISFFKWRFKQLEKDRRQLETEVKQRTLQIEKDKETITVQAEELKQLDKAKTRFFSNITHEFRTPLTLIIGPLRQLIKAKEDIPPIRLASVLNNAQSLLQLINQLLDISKLESGKMKVEVNRGDIILFAQELVEGFHYLATEKHIELVFFSKKGEWKTNFDKRKLEKVIYNLLSNAIKFTPKGGIIQFSLSKGFKKNQEWVVLNVRDNGKGISKEEQQSIFNRFYQVDDSSTRNQEGTGIGLSLVKELVELQGGEIWLTSRVGKGTTFEIYLPVLSISNGNNTQLIDSLDWTNSNSTHKKEIIATNLSIESNFSKATENKEKLHLLIVEDNKEMRAFIRSCIDTTIYRISEGVNGEDGIQKALTLMPDLIISDVMMPKKDGFELTATIRNNIATSHIPIILLTAKAALENKIKGLERGADAYLTKPFNPEELVVRIQKLIEIRKVLQNRYRAARYLNPPTSKIIEFESEDIFITNLKKFIQENLNDKLNGEIIGKHFRISRMQLHRKLKSLSNQSTSEFIKSVRLDIAYDLLLKKELNVSEIAYQTGFTSASNFSMLFKQKYNKAPSEIRK